MSTPEQPETPQLTRRQLREIRNTGATPVVTPEDLERAAAEAAASETAASDTGASEAAAGETSETPEIEDAQPQPQPTPAPLARAAEPVTIAEPPVADASVDLGVSPLTRRQARQQELIRTASVPVITPEVAAAHALVPAVQAEDAPESTDAPVDMPSWWAAVAVEDEESEADQAQDADELTDAEPAADSSEPSAPSEGEAATDLLDEADEDAGVEDVFAPLSAATDETTADGDSAAEEETAEDKGAGADERPILNPKFGAGLLAGASQTDALPPSFDQLITRSTTGSVATTNALIMAHPSGPSPISAVTATGEVLITGTFNLPDSLGSIGHVPGAADGKEVDASLIDGEIPAHSSPTPIAASAAISTVKSTGEVIRPPAPEKGSKLMISLAITAGVLALALVGVLIVAIVTGVFQ